MKEIILIDGKMLAYRAHFAHLGLRTKDGRPSGLLHGFLWELLRINKKVPEAAMVICWDGDGKTWRHEAYPKYKAQRPVNPEWKRMREQIEVLIPTLVKLGFRVCHFPGVEADDILGILSRQLNAEHMRIYSGDRDMYQLVRDGVCVWPKYDQPIIRIKEVEKWLGAPIKALIDIKAMAGDPADNLKGIPGVGFITARKLWREGYRIDDMMNAMRWAKYREHWLRLKKERLIATIICSEHDEVWTEKQRYYLATMVQDVDKFPWRNQRVGLMYKSDFYKFLGNYELKELFAERHKILSLP